MRRAWLGVVGARIPLIPEIAARVGSPTGMQVASVVTGSPAAGAGARAGTWSSRWTDYLSVVPRASSG
ncbi:hypothetical protein ACX80H_12920 [Arthrobacter sp. MDT2-2]